MIIAKSPGSVLSLVSCVFVASAAFLVCLEAAGADCTPASNEVGGDIPLRLPFRPGEAYPVTQGYCKTGWDHSGYQVDFGIPIGTPIVACSEGIVVQLGTYSGNCTDVSTACGLTGLEQGGLFVKLQHPSNEAGQSWYSSYLHLSAQSVTIGQRVEAGQTLGLSGNTGLSTGPHLHFHIRKGLTDNPLNVPANHVGVRPTPMTGLDLGTGANPILMFIEGSSYQAMDPQDVITNIMSPIVSYQYPDDFSSQALTNGGIGSPIVSYQYFEWPGDDVLHLQRSLPVSYFYGFGAGEPVIVQQPAGIFARLGSTAAFSVFADGAPPLSYQWEFNGVPLPGATEASLSLATVQLSDGGDYSVLVTNPNKSQASSVARLRVYLPPAGPEPPPPSSSPTGQAPPSELVAPPVTPGSQHLLVFTGGGVVDKTKITIVLTHGWIPQFVPAAIRGPDGSDGWPKALYTNLVQQGYQNTANILAWDWRANATKYSPTTAASFTKTEGNALGAALKEILGDSYSLKIHFMGHSLGTIVNCQAADFIHEHGFNPANSHMTLFDEAETVSVLDAYHFALGSNLNAETANFFIDNPWVRVIPRQYARVDNYVSLVGLLHAEAANVLLFREVTANPASAHGYSSEWYGKTMPDPLDSLAGHRWSFEFPPNSAPHSNTYFRQDISLNQPETKVDEMSELSADMVAGKYGFGVNRMLVYATAKAYQGVEYVETKVQDGIQYAGVFVQKVAEEFTPPTGIPVFTRTADSTPAYYQPSASPLQANWGINFTLGSLPGPLRTVGAGVYAWIPVTVPRDAVSLSFEFQISDSGTNEYMTMGISNANFFTMKAKYVEDGAWTKTSVVGISEYDGQDVPLFFSLNPEAGELRGHLSVRAIQFKVNLPPSLSAELNETNIIVYWPVSATGWHLESADALSSTPQWIPVTNSPAVLGYEYSVTNAVQTGGRFYRLAR